MIQRTSMRVVIAIPVLVLFLALSTHGQIEHSCFAELPFPSTPRAVFHLHGVSTSDPESGHIHEIGDLDSSTDSHSQGSGEESDHDSESHIHPREFTQSNAPNSIKIISTVTAVSPLLAVVSGSVETVSVLTLNSPHGPDPPLYLQSSALLI